MTITYGTGYRPGLLGWCVEQHGRYYAEQWNFGVFFETKVALDMAGFLRRLDGPRTHLLWAQDQDGDLATLALDAGGAESGLVHLRWFIVAERAQGQGVGKHLMANAVDQARRDDAKGIFLHTFAGLNAARKLYDHFGYQLVHEHEDKTWGVSVREQRFELRFS